MVALHLDSLFTILIPQTKILVRQGAMYTLSNLRK